MIEANTARQISQFEKGVLKKDSNLLQLPIKGSLKPNFPIQPEIKLVTGSDFQEDDDFDDILGSAIVQDSGSEIVDVSQEKAVLGYKSDVIQQNLSIKRSTVLNADSASDDGIIYSFRKLQDYKKSDPVRFVEAKQAILAKARMAQDADGCGGVNESKSFKSTSIEKPSKLGGSISFGGGSSNHSHAEGEGDHCECGADKENGVCKKCQPKAA